MSAPNSVSPHIARHRAVEGLRDILGRHDEVRRLLDIVDRRGKRWAIVGGAPRHWALAVPGDPDDLDIAVSMPPAILDTVIEDWQRGDRGLTSITSTAFGGYRIKAETWAVDIWAVAKTVGLANGQVTDTKSFRAVARSAALSLDSIVLTSRGAVYEQGFFATVQTGILRMNHCSVERPSKVAEKALRLCEHFCVVPDISVQALIASALGRGAIEAILASRPFGISPLTIES